MSATSPVCGDERRRQRVRQPGADGRSWNGLDDIEVSDDQRTLTVTFLRKAPPQVEPYNVRIDGGVAVTGIRVVGVRMCRLDDPELDDCMEVVVDRPGDFSTYTLRLVEPGPDGRPGDLILAGFDPRYAQLRFSFKVNCPSVLDCAPDDTCPPAAIPEPEIDYLAKDYASFRQLILDRLGLIMPAWTERHIPDVGIALVELLAYVGDQLSYYQDAVATEAYLDTARRRVSVRRHVRLVDYAMHDGCNARALVHLAVTRQVTLPAGDFWFATALPPPPAGAWPVAVRAAATDTLPAAAYEVFEPVRRADLELHPQGNEIRLWTWGDSACCLPTGATAATLVDPAPTEGGPAWLRAGDLLLFEEVRGPRTGAPADADPGHRQAVRLTRVAAGMDELYQQAIVEVEWAQADALRFPLCISAVGGPDCELIDPVSVARANLVLVDHGRTIPGCEQAAEELQVPWVAPGPPDCPEPDEPSQGARMRQLWRTARDGTALTAAEVEELRAVVGAAAADAAGLTPPGDVPGPDTAAAQAAALGRLLTQGTGYPPAAVAYTAVLERYPVTLRTAFPDWATVARGQAGQLEGILDRVLARVQELLGQVRAGQPLSGEQLEELRVVFGARALADAGLEPAAPGTPDEAAAAAQARALARLVARERLLLARKRRRLDGLARRARAGQPLGDQEVDELRRSLGPSYVKALERDNPRWLGPAAGALAQDPRAALPAICLQVRPAAGAALRPCADQPGAWALRRDLLVSGPTDRHFVAELDEQGRAQLRFGDGRAGRAPTPGSTLLAEYRVGNGTAGNVGAEAIAHLVLCSTDQDAVSRVRNPLPAAGGLDPEPLAEVRLLAPATFRRRLERAVTAQDYATLAGRVPGVQRAAATLAWTGSWYEVQVAVDPLGAEEADPALLGAVEEALHPYRRIGHDLTVRSARTVALDVRLRVCAQPHHQRGQVAAAVLEALGNRQLAGGARGFFHPDNLEFGDDVRASRLVAAALAVPGVASADLLRLRRFGEGDHGELDQGLLPIGPLEVARLDNDPSVPEHGVLTLELGGGR
jgi:hypothetical protein